MSIIEYIPLGIFLTIFLGILWYVNFLSNRSYLILKSAKKYPKVYKDMVIRFIYPLFVTDLSNLKSRLKAIKIINSIKLFGAISKEDFDKSFNKLWNYEGIKKTRDKQLIESLDNYRKWSRLYYFIFNLSLLSFALLVILFAIIFVIVTLVQGSICFTG